MSWRRVDKDFWWCSDVGSAVKKSDGWHASSSGYRDVLLEPSVGPFRTAKLAITAFEKARSERRSRPTADEVMLAALDGAGITDQGLPAATRLWKALLPEVEVLEREFSGVESEIDGFMKRVLGGLLARCRYAASIEARRRRRR